MIRFIKNNVKKILVTGLALQGMVFHLNGQTLEEKTLFSVGNEPVTAGEFIRIYLKNSNTGVSGKVTTVDEYLDLYTKFKLKVHAAEEALYDTLPAFIKELNGYREQLAKPYLTDQKTTDKLSREAWERMQKDVDASHILIRLNPDAAPEDTLRAYEKIMKIRERLLRGEDFERIARATSDDPPAKNNGGHLGYFTAFQMVYPFETAAYETAPGRISMPVRTRFGYHLIKVNDVRDDPGQIKVAHIMIAVPRGSSVDQQKKAEEKANNIYRELLNGADFGELAKKYSDDYNSARQNGELPWFGTGRMIPSFSDAAFGLKENGALSSPVKTSYGWHIIKRIDHKDLGSFEEHKAEIEKKINSGDRSGEAKEAFYDHLKKDYGYWIDYGKMGPLTENPVPGKFSDGTWQQDPGIESVEPVFGFAGKKYTLKNVGGALEKYFKTHKNTPLTDATIKEAINQYVDKELMAYEKSRLEIKYPGFGLLMKEYHDGMLLFDISDKLIWSKAINDTVGLKKYYDQNSQKYMGGERLKLIDFTVFSPGQSEQILKTIQRKRRKGPKINYFEKLYPSDTSRNVIVQTMIIEKGTSARCDSIDWNKGSVYQFNQDGNTHIWLAVKPLKAVTKPLNEVRGQVASDYQQLLEKQWIESLQARYPVTLNKEVLSEVKKAIQNDKK